MASIDQELKTNFTGDKHRFIANVVFTGNWVKKISSDFLKPFNISSQQFNILRILRGAKDWVSMNDIRELMVEKSPNATRLCDKLVDKELVERQRTESDRRVVYLRISEKGLGLLGQIDEKEGGEHFNFLDRVTDEEAKLISKILDRMRG